MTSTASSSSLRSGLLHPLAKPLVFVLCLLPWLWLAWAAVNNQLGANPAEALIRALGDWALRFLCLTLAVTPLRIRTRTPQLARYRRMLGLFTFFYACSHLLAYAWFDMGLDWPDIGRDILKRPFILIGFATWLLMLPLALTSFNRAVRWLGGRHWRSLHQTVYAIGPLAVLHFLWMRSSKGDTGEVWLYAAAMAVLLLERLLRYFTPTPRL